MESNDYPSPKKARLNTKASNKTSPSLQRNPSHNVTHEDEQIPGPSGTQRSERTKSNISSVYKEVPGTSNSVSEGNDSTFTHAGETNHSDDSADNNVKIVKSKSFVTKEPSRDDNLEKTLYCDACLNLCKPNLDYMDFPNDFEHLKTIISEDDAPTDYTTLTKQTATCMCFDYNQYLCPKCAHAHSEHPISNIDDSQTKKDETFETLIKDLEEDIMDDFNDDLEELFVCDKIDAFVPSEDTESKCSITGICVLSHSGMWAITDSANCSLKIFNLYNNKLIQYIRFSSPPTDISEVPPKPTLTPMHDGSDKVKKHCYVAVLFSKEEQLLVVDLSNFLPNITEILKMPGECEQVFYCKDKIVTSCYDSIHVLSITGEMVHTIDTRSFESYRYLDLHLLKVTVHKETETIYVLFGCYVEVDVVSYDMAGRILSRFKKFDYGVKFGSICVDSEQNVYVATHEDYSDETLLRVDGRPRAKFTIHKLSPDLKPDHDEREGYGVINAFECNKNTFYIRHRWRRGVTGDSITILRSEHCTV